ncbi:MAG: SMC family ATPase [Candidatus Nezhaarchaeota archaeon]|nr:SMC family ATPase [Candidatus Nezhaarchaeota archaeon]
MEKLELLDFLSHRNTALTFGKGLTAIIGPNGSGKSSMIEGIVYSLFQDSFRSLRGGTKESLKRIGAKSAFVRLTFNVAGRVFKAERAIERGATDRLYEGDRLIASQTATVDNKILEILGIPRKEAYLNTVIVRQGELERILESFTAASGREELMRALGFKELEDIAEELKEERDWALRKEIEKAEKAKYLGNWKRQLERLEAEFKRLEAERTLISEKLKALQKGLSHIEKELSGMPESLEIEFQELLMSYSAKRNRLQQLNNNVEKLKEKLKRLNDLKTELTRINSLISFKERLRHLQKTLEAAAFASPVVESLTATISKNLDRFNFKLKTLAQALYCSPDIDSVIKAYEELKCDVELKEREASGLKTIIEEKKAILSGLHKSGSACPLCGAELTSEAKLKLHEKIEGEISEATINLEKALNILDEKKKLLHYLDKLNVKGLVNEANTINEDIRRKEEEERKLMKSLEDANRALEDVLSREVDEELASKLRKLITVLDAPLEAMEAARDIMNFINRVEGRVEELKKKVEEEEETKRELEGAVQEVEQLSRDVEGLEVKIKDVKEKVETRRKLVEKNISVKSEIANCEWQLSNIEKGLEERRKAIQELKDLCEEAEKAQEEAKRIRLFAEFLDYVRNEIFGKDGIIARNLRGAYRNKLENDVNDYLSRFGMDFEVEFDYDLKLKVEVGGKEVNVDNLSGGEKAVLALSTRLALAKALSAKEVEFIILDEPTANLDSDRRRELIRVLRDLADEIPQVIVVTHDLEVAEAADQLYKVRKMDGASIVEAE